MRSRFTVYYLQGLVSSDRSVGPSNQYSQTRAMGALTTAPKRIETNAQASVRGESK